MSQMPISQMNASAVPPRIVIVGAGFGGIALAIALKKAGIHSFVMLERAADIGGVWRDNTYPGAACDVPSSFYSYSFERKWRWHGRFGGQGEILAYIRHCVAKYGLAPHIRLGIGVESAAFDAASRRWRVATSTGERLEPPVLVSAVGLFNRPILPDIPGRGDFAGPHFHSAHWRHDVPLDGKTVAVIGTGASAIQFVPAIAGRVGRLHVFQRSPHYVMPRIDPLRSPRGRLWRTLSRGLDRLHIYLSFERGIPRRSSAELTRKGEEGFHKYLAAQVRDPELRRKLTPDTPLGCKRVLQSNDWYAALQRPNVELVDTAIDAILPDGVRTKDGAVRKVDAIIYGTGFSPTDFLSSLRVTGLDGRDLHEVWRDGAEAYLGLTVAGFPNFFMLYGPNTNVAGSILYMLESQARYVVSCVRALDRAGRSSMILKADVQRRFNDDVRERLERTVIFRGTCHSYFRTAAGKITTQWPGYMFEYRRRTRRVAAADYDFAGS